MKASRIYPKGSIYDSTKGDGIPEDVMKEIYNPRVVRVFGEMTPQEAKKQKGKGLIIDEVAKTPSPSEEERVRVTTPPEETKETVIVRRKPGPKPGTKKKPGKK